MAVSDAGGLPAPLDRPVATEFGLVTAALVGLYLWQRAVSAATAAVDVSSSFGLPVGGLVSGGVFVAGLALFAVAYAARRDVDVEFVAPARGDRWLVGLAGLAPVAFVGATKLVGDLTGVPYNSLTMTAVAADAPVTPVLALLGVSLLVGVPTLVLVCQVLVQGSFERVIEGDVAVVLTTLLAGFAMTSDTGGLAAVPDRGRLLGVVLLALALVGGRYASERVTDDRLRRLAYAPALLVVALVVLSGVAEVQSVAGGLFAVTHLAVFGIAADTYRRSGSLLAPAVAYASLLLANRAVVFAFEAGMQSW